MSFHWNLSSEDELEGDENDEIDRQRDSISKFSELTSIHSHELASISSVHEQPLIATNIKTYNSREEDLDDDIDWEDASEESEDDVDDGDLKPAARELRPVVIDLVEESNAKHHSQKKEVDKARRKTKTRKVYRNSTLPATLANFLLDLHKSHLLMLISRSVFLSTACSDDVVMHLSHSMIPLEYETTALMPSMNQVHLFCKWYFDFINRANQRRAARIQSNLAAGAPRQQRKRRKIHDNTPPSLSYHLTDPVYSLTQLCLFLSSVNAENPQLEKEEEDNVGMTDRKKALLMVSLTRSMGWRSRYVIALDPMRQDLDVDHPLMNIASNIFSHLGVTKPKSSKGLEEEKAHNNREVEGGDILAWVEILCMGVDKPKWIHVDVSQEWIDQPRFVESKWYSIKNGGMLSLNRRLPLVYVLAVEHLQVSDDSVVLRLTDVTPRYANSWSKSQKLRGNHVTQWFANTISAINRSASQRQQSLKDGTNYLHSIDVENEDISNPEISHFGDEIDASEAKDLTLAASSEVMPTSKAAFASHGIYVLASQLGKQEVLHPDAKSRICGMFKGEIVYRRSDVFATKEAKKWLYEGRRVRDNEKPIKRIQARKKVTPQGFRPLSNYGVGVTNDGSDEFRRKQIEIGSAMETDGKKDLFAIWQTEPWRPAFIGPEDPIPKNDYGNMELALMNPGLEHIDQPGVAKVAKSLGMYVPESISFIA
jgi:xeroderma pigmentosum group C-complementing protein